MDDLIRRNDAIEHCKKRLYETAVNNFGLKCKAHEVISAIEEDGIDIWLNEVPSAQQWIPCSEQMPEVGKEILFCDDFGDIYVGHRATEHWWSVDDKVKSVVAWQALPEPYKGD